MSSVNRAIGAVQRKLLFPSQPSEGIIGEFYIETVDEKVTELGQTREAWFASKTAISVVPGRDEYLLDALAPNLGKARFMWTKDDSDPYFQRRPVDIVQLEDLTTYYRGGDANPTPSPAAHSALACAIYYEPGFGNKIVFGPTPNQNAQYVLVYEPATVRPQSLENAGFRFSQFDSYLSDCTALRCLPGCEWSAIDKAEWADRRAELRLHLAAEVTRGDSLFRRWKWSQNQPQDRPAIGFGSSRY